VYCCPALEEFKLQAGSRKRNFKLLKETITGTNGMNLRKKKADS